MIGVRKRLLYCSSVVPQRTGAGELLVYRHLARLTDWDVMVVGPQDRPAEGDYGRQVTVESSVVMRSLIRLRRGPLWAVADRVEGRQVTARLSAAADGFGPDVVVSVNVPDIYLTAAAQYAASRGIPLAIFCHDDYEGDVPPSARGYLGSFYRQAAVRFCVSRVMEREYGRRYGVPGLPLYPIPGQAPKSLRPQRDEAPLVVGYAGALGRGYEQAMVALADALAGRGGRLVIAWRTLRTIAAQVWRHPAVTDLGALDPDHVEPALMQAGVNVLCVVQSFDPLEARIRLNFPSKLTEYMMLRLPILVVAPEYASVPLWLAEERGLPSW